MKTQRKRKKNIFFLPKVFAVRGRAEAYIREGVRGLFGRPHTHLLMSTQHFRWATIAIHLLNTSVLASTLRCSEIRLRFLEREENAKRREPATTMCPSERLSR